MASRKHSQIRTAVRRRTAKIRRDIAAKNLVLDRFARGEFFAHQDADDRSLPRRLASHPPYRCQLPTSRS